MEEWLNDTTIDGFLGNLREPDKFIVTDAKWNATEDAAELGSIPRPSDSGTIVTDTVGLLNTYEYQAASKGYILENQFGIMVSNGYLKNELFWWTLTPYSSSDVRYVGTSNVLYGTPSNSNAIRPSINLKSSVKIVDGDGTEDNPYRLEGDNDSNLSGTLLNTRYSGEYIRFGTGENNLYRIVSHENGVGTKITSAEPLKDSGTFKQMAFDSNRNVNYTNTNTIGTFLNGEYLTNYVDSTYSDMIEDSTIWYLGTVGSGASYKLAKYTDVTGNTATSNVTQAKVGLLRFGELMSGQFDVWYGNITYWILTPFSTSYVRAENDDGRASGNLTTYILGVGIKPSLNLKSNVVITGGNGTKNSPFTLS